MKEAERKALDLALAKHQAGDLACALTAYQRLYPLYPEIPELCYFYGLALVQCGKIKEAIPLLEKAVSLKPNSAPGFYNLALAYYMTENLPAARKAWEESLRLNPNNPDAWNNLGVILRQSDKKEAAEGHFRKALDLGHKDAEVNLANLLLDMGRIEESLPLHLAARKKNPQNIGLNYELLKSGRMSGDFALAEAAYAELSKLIPGQKLNDPRLIANLLYQDVFTPWPLELRRQLQGELNGLLQRPTLPLRPRKPGKIRLGYMSPNFGDHPVGHVTLGLFAAHDRERFEVHGFSFKNRADESEPFALAHRQGFDKFHDLEALSTAAKARYIQDQAIDILIDLDGFMGQEGLKVMAYRPALSQIFWLGHAGGLGLSFIDYLIADEVVIPPSDITEYREKIIYLPVSYHCASPYSVGEKPRRKDYGLPEEDVVFCGFNNPEKIDRLSFSLWMKVLSRVPGSVLWLSNPKKSRLLEENLRKAAAEFGIAGERLIFAGRVKDKKEHLGRQQLADVFLDTLSLNASTTALDAFLSGLPLLTVKGERFASRISQAMLKSLGMEELISPTSATLVEKAVALAGNKEEIQRLKDRIKQNIPHAFNIKAFTNKLEASLKEI